MLQPLWACVYASIAIAVCVELQTDFGSIKNAPTQGARALCEYKKALFAVAREAKMRRTLISSRRTAGGEMVMMPAQSVTVQGFGSVRMQSQSRNAYFTCRCCWRGPWRLRVRVALPMPGFSGSAQKSDLGFVMYAPANRFETRRAFVSVTAESIRFFYQTVVCLIFGTQNFAAAPYGKPSRCVYRDAHACCLPCCRGCLRALVVLHGTYTAQRSEVYAACRIRTAVERKFLLI